MKPAFKTIAKFQYSTEAQIIKGRLESEGIKVFLSDHITIDTDPLVSNAIGGVKLKVLAEQEAQALHILDSIKKYSINDDGNIIHCPDCHGSKIELFSTVKDTKSFISFFIGFIFGSLPLSTKYKYRCETCHTEFELK